MSKAADELMKKLEAEEKAHDDKMLAQGMRFKVDAWIHPKDGDDKQISLYTNKLPTWPDLGKRLSRSVVKHDWRLRDLTSDLVVIPLDATMRKYKAILEAGTFEAIQGTIEEAVAAVQKLFKQGIPQEAPAEPAAAPVEPSVEPSEEPEEDSDSCYVVICHDEEFNRVEIYAVLAPAARFARRAARKQWKNDHGADAGIEFNARFFGPNER